MKIAALLGKLILILATMLFIAGVSLFIVGSYLITWPILRTSPATRRKRAVTQAMVSVMTLAQAFAPDPGDDEGESHAQVRPSSPPG